MDKQEFYAINIYIRNWLYKQWTEKQRQKQKQQVLFCKIFKEIPILCHIATCYYIDDFIFHLASLKYNNILKKKSLGLIQLFPVMIFHVIFNSQCQ